MNVWANVLMDTITRTDLVTPLTTTSQSIELLYPIIWGWIDCLDVWITPFLNEVYNVDSAERSARLSVEVLMMFIRSDSNNQMAASVPVPVNLQ